LNNTITIPEREDKTVMYIDCSGVMSGRGKEINNLTWEKILPSHQVSYNISNDVLNNNRYYSRIDPSTNTVNNQLLSGLCNDIVHFDHLYKYHNLFDQTNTNGFNLHTFIEIIKYEYGLGIGKIQYPLIMDVSGEMKYILQSDGMTPHYITGHLIIEGSPGLVINTSGSSNTIDIVHNSSNVTINKT